MTADTKWIEPGELMALLDKDPGLDVIDVRTAPEFSGVHASMARLVPLDRLEPEAFLGARDVGSAAAVAPVYILCKSGARAAKAAERFAAAGFANAVVVRGGTDAWLAAGLPVTRGRKTMSLERQVRIGAGVLILAFSSLAVAVHPAFVAGCAFVGAGLTFAGVTDWCGLGLLLARMPWNGPTHGPKGE